MSVRRFAVFVAVLALVMSGGTAVANDTERLPGAKNPGVLRAAFEKSPGGFYCPTYPCTEPLPSTPFIEPLYNAKEDGRLFFNTWDIFPGDLELCHGETYGAWAYLSLPSKKADLIQINIWIDDVPLDIEVAGPKRAVRYGDGEKWWFASIGVPVLDDWALTMGDHTIDWELVFPDGEVWFEPGSYTVVDC